MTKRVLLFDLGGVLVDWRGLAELGRLAAPHDDAREVRRRFVASEALRDFETGRCDRRDFAARFVAEWRLGLEAEAFLGLFRSWLRGPFPGTLESLDALRGSHRLACLSNTNEMHWQHMMVGLGLAEALDHRYASHLLGLVKPDRAIFERVLADLAVAPSAVTFFDDGADNVEAARALGIESHLVDPRHGVQPTLRALGLL
ncbi:putative hydrolase of the HAD superfamily [Tistlia consotensis]|uniref:Putative hydrolase of the HAD superfamily n=1 Tax=Tistlia consotensis USBA 355 TaxID=560819 RepID=A0A1Y6BQ21_9PROT|nr:HAD family phosphatase [Tistlia consotensis]SMF21434.1 putative hydrolase of the HAD superfamily [Tistlia consotensis USBA 355]SNR46922.1 putative hydrolase of the HAD superfamily [Tistlia consotensis]